MRQIKQFPATTTEWNGPCFTFANPKNVIKGGKLILWNSQFYTDGTGFPLFLNAVENPSNSYLDWGSAVFDGDNGGSFVNAGNLTIGALNMQKQIGLYNGAMLTNKASGIMVLVKLGFNWPDSEVDCTVGKCGTITNQGTLYIEKCGSIDYGNVRIVNDGTLEFSSLGFGIWAACPYLGNGYVKPGPYFELTQNSKLVLRAYSPSVVGTPTENMDIINYSDQAALKSTCKLDGTLHVKIQFPTFPSAPWTINSGDEWKFWPFVHLCSGGFSKVEWSGVGGQLDASLSLSLKIKNTDLTAGGKDLYVVVCSATDTMCNTLPAKIVPPSPPGSSPSSSSALSFVLSWLLFICFFLKRFE
jgi:hypothetical protein